MQTSFFNHQNDVEQIQRRIKIRSRYIAAVQATSYARKLSVDAKQRRPLAKLLVDSNTAIGSVFRTNTLIQRRLWLAIYVVLVGFTIYYSGAIIRNYFAHEAVYVLDIKDLENNATLPAITICNKNTVRKTLLCARQADFIRKWHLSRRERAGLFNLCKEGRSNLTAHTYRQVIPQLVEPEVVREFGHDIKGE